MTVICSFSEEEKWEAVKDCVSLYDDFFYYGVKTTKIYCKPSCASKTPNVINVCYFESLQQAQEAGYRPCKRCQPDEIESRKEKEKAVSEVKEMIHRHYDKPLNLKEVVKWVHFSPFHFHRLFKQETTVTIHQYIKQVRVNKAKWLLLNTTKSQLDISLEVGFNSFSPFYQAFKQQMKCTPKEFKERSQ